MLATSALGSPGVCVYKWQDSSLKTVVHLNHFGDGGSTAVNINHNNQVIASAGETGEVILSVPENGRDALFKFTAMTNREVRSVSFDTSSRYLGCGGDFEQVYIWDLKKKKKVRELKGHTASDTVSSLSFSNDGHYIASGGSSGTILIHSVRERHIASTLTATVAQSNGLVPSSLGQLCFSPMNPNILGAAYSRGEVAIYDISTAAAVCELQLHASNATPGFGSVHQGRYGALSFSPINHKFVVSGGEDGKLVFLDYETKGVVRELDPNLGPITVTSFIDGIFVTAATSKGVMFVYDLRNTTEPLQTFRDHSALPVNSMHFHEIAPETMLLSPGSTASVVRTTADLNRLSMASNASNNSKQSPPPQPPVSTTETLSFASSLNSNTTYSNKNTEDMSRASPNSLRVQDNQPVITTTPNRTNNIGFKSDPSSASPRPNTPPLSVPTQQVANSPSISMRLPVSGSTSPISSNNPSELPKKESISTSFSSAGYVAPTAKEILSNSSILRSSSPTHSSASPAPSQYGSSGLSSVAIDLNKDYAVSSNSALTLEHTKQEALSGTSTLHYSPLRQSNNALPIPPSSSSSSPVKKAVPPPLPPAPSVTTRYAPREEDSQTITPIPPTSKTQPPPTLSTQTSSSASSVVMDRGGGRDSTALVNDSSSDKRYTSLMNSSSIHNSSSGGGQSFLRENKNMSSEMSQRPPDRFERKLVEECVSEAMDEAKREIRRDIQGLHLDMLNQFEDQQQAITSILDQYTQRLAALVQENEALRRENEDLRRLY